VSEPVVRALVASDAVSARVLLDSAFGGTRHFARMVELLEQSLPGDDPEARGLVSAFSDGSVRGVLLFGSVAGANGVIRLHVLTGHPVDALSELITAVRAVDSSGSARIFLCEFSDEPEHVAASRALVSAGFTREAAIADYFADGIGLDILVLRP
jgi:hypothetical protein